MQEITLEEFEAAISDSLCECFEMFFDQKYYFEVLEGTHSFVGRLDDCTTCDYHNASCYFYYDGTQYACQRDRSLIKSTYYRYDTLDEAREHAVELLKTVIR